MDPITERDVPILADGLFDATDSTAPADRGPAAIAVMARGRDQESQAIELTAWTVVRNRLAIELLDAGRARGLATLDLVEEAMSGLPVHGLPALLVESAAVRFERTDADLDSTIHVYVTRCTWPAAFPETPLATDADSSTQAIRDHVEAAILAGLPSAVSVQAGANEADKREAHIAGMVPRAWIELKTQREAIGGAPDFVVRDPATFADSESPPRTWTAQVVTQTVIVEVYVGHRTETLADAAIVRIAGELEGSVVIWPGSFDARVLEAGAMVTRRLTGGQYAQDVRLLMFERAEWDAALGLGVAKLQAAVEAVDPIAPATQRVKRDAAEPTATLVVPVGSVKVETGDDLAVGEEVHGLADAITATSDDTGIATVTVAGSVLTITGVAAGDVDLLIEETSSGAHRLLRVQVRR